MAADQIGVLLAHEHLQKERNLAKTDGNDIKRVFFIVSEQMGFMADYFFWPRTKFFKGDWWKDKECGSKA